MSEKIHGTIVHVIDGVKYREVGRKAKVGDYVLAIKYADNDAEDGYVGKVADVHDTGYSMSDGVELDIRYDSLVVLEPIYTCGTCGEGLGELCCTSEKSGSYCSLKCAEPTPTVHDLLANLTRRLAKLERENAELRETIDGALKNVVTFAEQTETNSQEIRELKLRELEREVRRAEQAKTTVSGHDAMQQTIEVLCAHIAKQSGGAGE